MRNEIPCHPTLDPETEAKAAEAFKRFKPTYEALRPADLKPGNVCGQCAARVALTTIEKLRQQPELVERLLEMGMPPLELIEAWAFALLHADALCARSARSGGTLAELRTEAMQLRKRFHDEAMNLVTNRIVDQAWLKNYSGGPGYRALIDDVYLLGIMFNTLWPKLQGKMCRTLEELDRAERVVNRMMRELDAHERGISPAAECRNWKKRAFTVLWIGYDELRRALVFVRHAQRDADAIAPSLYHRRQRRSRHAEPVALEQRSAILN